MEENLALRRSQMRHGARDGDHRVCRQLEVDVSRRSARQSNRKLAERTRSAVDQQPNRTLQLQSVSGHQRRIRRELQEGVGRHPHRRVDRDAREDAVVSHVFAAGALEDDLLPRLARQGVRVGDVMPDILPLARRPRVAAERHPARAHPHARHFRRKYRLGTVVVRVVGAAVNEHM